MPILSSFSPAKYGRRAKPKVWYEDVAAPASDVTITAGGTADVEVSVPGSTVIHAAVESVSGLPAGVYISAITLDKAAKKITLTLYNASGSNVTISAGSLTVGVLSYA